MLPLKAHSMFCLTLSPEKVLKKPKATWHAWQETSVAVQLPREETTGRRDSKVQAS